MRNETMATNDKTQIYIIRQNAITNATNLAIGLLQSNSQSLILSDDDDLESFHAKVRLLAGMNEAWVLRTSKNTLQQEEVKPKTFKQL